MIYNTHKIYRYTEQTSLKDKLATRLNKKARPVAPVNLVDINSPRLVNAASHDAHVNKRVPPKWVRKIRPMLTP